MSRRHARRQHAAHVRLTRRWYSRQVDRHDWATGAAYNEWWWVRSRGRIEWVRVYDRGER